MFPCASVGRAEFQSADSFPSISGLLDLTGTPFGPAHSGTNVVAGLGSSRCPGSQAVIDFRNFVEVRVLEAGATFVSEWIQLFRDGYHGAREGLRRPQLRRRAVFHDGEHERSFQLRKEQPMTRWVAWAITDGCRCDMTGGGAWINGRRAATDGGTVPEPHTALLLTAGVISPSESDAECVISTLTTAAPASKRGRRRTCGRWLKLSTLNPPSSASGGASYWVSTVPLSNVRYWPIADISQCPLSTHSGHFAVLRVVSHGTVDDVQLYRAVERSVRADARKHAEAGALEVHWLSGSPDGK